MFVQRANSRSKYATLSDRKRSWLRLLKLAFATLLIFATCGPSVDAQEDTPAAFFRADRERMRILREGARPARPAIVQRPTRMIPHAAPVKGYARTAPARRRDAPFGPMQPGDPASADPALASPDPGAAPANDAITGEPAVADTGAAPAAPAAAPVTALPAPTPPVPAAAGPAFTIAVIGDSLGILLSQGLTEAFADKPEIAILRRARENTGLVRDDYFDWTKGARDVAAGDKANLVVMMIGSNDRQTLRDGAGPAELRSPRWNQAYAERVDAILQIFRERKIPVIWVGLPVMKNERFSADMAAMNEIFKQRAGKAGAAYVESWEPFLDDRGQYGAYGPDVNGQFQKLRSADGVHFTKPGARKLAYFLESEIRAAVQTQRPPVSVEIAVSAPAQNAAPPRAPPAAAPAGANSFLLLPAPPVAPQVNIPVKPAEGAIVALTAPVLSPGGQLAAAIRAPVNSDPARAIVERALVQGRPLDARPGRADDFSWPKR